MEGWASDDVVAVLPDDLPRRWTWFAHTRIKALALAKYDLWPNLLVACRNQGIPVHVFAAAPSDKGSDATPSTPAVWKLVRTVSVQDEAAANAFERIGLRDRLSIDGDPRIERVLTRSATPAKAWRDWAASSAQVVVAGSTWPEEERALRTLDWHPQRRLVLVPHDVSAAHLDALDRHGREGPFAPRPGSTWTPRPVSTGVWSLWTAQAICLTCTASARWRSWVAGTAPAFTTSWSRHRPGCHRHRPRPGAFREAHALRECGALTSGDVAELTSAWLADGASCRQFGAEGRAWLESQHGASERIVLRWS